MKTLENDKNYDDEFKFSYKEKIINLKKELQEEINLFKNENENQLIEIIKNFFKTFNDNNFQIMNCSY